MTSKIRQDYPQDAKLLHINPFEANSIFQSRKRGYNAMAKLILPFLLGAVVCYLTLAFNGGGEVGEASSQCSFPVPFRGSDHRFKILKEDNHSIKMDTVKEEALAKEDPIIAPSVPETAPVDLVSPISSTPATTSSKLGLVSMVWGDGKYQKALQSAAETHSAYTKKHGFKHFLLEQPLYDLIWSKPAYMASLVLSELAKPKGSRLEWLVWADIDTIISNPNVALDSFLPPQEFNDVHLMTTYDIFGLNNGVFFLRVSEWSFKLLNHIISYPHFRPEESLGNADQTAMGLLLEQDKFKKHALIMPQHFFNGYRIGMLEGENTKPGGLFMHFPGGNKEFMDEWLGYLQGNSNSTWNLPYEDTDYPHEIASFWDDAWQRKNDGLPLYYDPRPQ